MNDIAEFVLPQGILEYFTITNLNQTPKELYIYLEEKKQLIYKNNHFCISKIVRFK